MNLEIIPITKEGHQKLAEELEQLKNVERHAVIKSIAEARSHGDLKENAEYHAAREKQAFIEARITELDGNLSRAQVIQHNQSPDSIGFGAWVKLCDEDTGDESTYRIVGDLEANIDKKLLSVSSPMAKALLSKKVDDVVEIRAPRGRKEYVILEVTYR